MVRVVDNFSLTNEVLIGNHVKTGLGLLTSSAMAKRVGTVSVGMAASNWWRTGTIATGGMAAVNTVGSIVANSAINAAAVTVALEAGIGVGSALNAVYQTYFQNDDCACP